LNVLVDTCVWSESFRHPSRPETINIRLELGELIKEGRVVLIGAIRQEILSGIRSHQQFIHLREQMKAFSDYPVSSGDYEYAAELFNKFRSMGIQGSNTDFLICAVAMRSQLSIFTLDKDFYHFAKHVKLHLHLVRLSVHYPNPISL
jgi:predicted nucleic acid-binding protein